MNQKAKFLKVAFENVESILIPAGKVNLYGFETLRPIERDDFKRENVFQTNRMTIK